MTTANEIVLMESKLLKRLNSISKKKKLKNPELKKYVSQLSKSIDDLAKKEKKYGEIYDKSKYLNEEKIKEEISEDAIYVYDEMVESLQYVKIEKNKTKVKKHADILLKELNRIHKNKSKKLSNKDEKAVAAAIGKFVKGLVSSGRSVKSVKCEVAVEKAPYINAAITTNNIIKSDQMNDKANVRVKIYVTDKAIQKLKPEELLAVLLHELGHLYYVSKKGNSMAHLGATYFLYIVRVILSLVAVKQLVSGGKKLKNTLIILLITIAAEFSIDYSRYKGGTKMEAVADAYASFMGYGKELANAFEKMDPNMRAYPKNLTKARMTKIMHNIIKFTSQDPHDISILRVCRSYAIVLKDPAIKNSKAKYDILASMESYNCKNVIKAWEG